MVTKVQFHFHILENKEFLQLLNWCKCEIHHMQLNCFSTSLFYMLQSTLSLIKYAQPNPISSVIVAIIHDGENEPREWGSLHFSLFFLTSEKKAILNVAHQKKKMSTKQTRALLTHNTTRKEKGAWRSHCLNSPKGSIDCHFSCK